MLKNRKKIFIGAFIFLVVGSLGWFSLLEYGSTWIKQEVAAAILDLQQKGYEVSYSTIEFRGTPFSLELILQNPRLKDPQGRLDWQGQEVKVRMRPWNLYTFVITLPHSQKVAFFIPQNKTSSLWDVSLEGAQGTVKVTHYGVLDAVFLRVDRLSFLTEKQLYPIFLEDFSLKIRDFAHPLTLQLSCSSKVKGLDVLMKATSPLEPLLFSFEAALSGFKEEISFPHSLAEWRDGGGVLDINLLKLTWHPVLAEGEGTLTFDQEMYPLGAFSTRVTGYQEALTRMVELGYVKKNNADIASFVLGMLSQSDDKGSKQLTVPLTLQNKRVSVGAIPLFKISY